MKHVEDYDGYNYALDNVLFDDGIWYWCWWWW